MAEVHQRCRRLGFPLLIKTNKKIYELSSVELLWLFYYLLEIYEPCWSHTPIAFTRSDYKPLSTNMRLLELAHKCPKSKELKKPFEHKNTIISSLGAVLDKLEAKHGKNKLYSHIWKHQSLIGMKKKKNIKNIKTTKNIQKSTQNVSNINEMNENANKNQNKCIPPPRATSTDFRSINNTSLNSIMNCDESKKEETVNDDNDISMKQQDDEKAIQSVETNDGDDDDDDDVSMNDLKLYDFCAPAYKNETISFHLSMRKNDNDLTMTERYEKLKENEISKKEKIFQMRDEYNNILCELKNNYSFNAKLFQNTSSTDYARFQLESIKQKLISENKLKEKSIDLIDDNDGIDNLLNQLSDQVQGWIQKP